MTQGKDKLGKDKGALTPELAALGFDMAAPAAPLRPFVQGYWKIATPEPLADVRDYKIITDGGAGIVMNFADPFAISFSDGAHVLDGPWSCVVTGATKKAVFLRLSGHVEAWGIRFHPGGAYPFLQRDMGKLTDLVIRAEDFTHLHDALGRVRGLSDGVDVLNSSLLSRLETVSPDLWLQQVIADIQTAQGHVRVADLAAARGVSSRSLERRFQKAVGLSPKVYAQIVRMELSRALIKSAETQTLTDIGLVANYYDQAHFIREFKTFVETTPKQYRREKS